MITKEFSELLKGCRPVKDGDGNIIVQSIMNMQVVCLTTDDEFSLDSRFANPLTSLVSSNSSYGQITFNNIGNKEVIIPTQMAIMTKQRAQNHGMVKAGYVEPKSQKTYRDAGCVQGSQTGYFHNTNEYRMMPVTMREMLFDVVGQTGGYSSIYPSIQKLGRDTNSNTSNYLDVYFNKYDKKLEQFIAHFERPRNLIGIIILIDGEIVAIDKFPSFTYSEQVWDLMIRDCYGSLAIISELKDRTSNKVFTETYNELKNGGTESFVELLEKALKKTKEKITTSVYDKIEELLDVSFDLKLDRDGESSTLNAPKSYVLNANGYVGQVIIENEFNHMVSVVKREGFNPNALREVNELRRKARKQERFKL